jgi:putative hydrolase of the HAD superfamily
MGLECEGARCPASAPRDLPAAPDVPIVGQTSKPRPMPRAILFDLFETLITESRDPPRGVSSLAPEFGCAREAFRAQWKARRPAVTVGRLSFRQALEEIALSLGQHADEATLQRTSDDRIRAKAQPFERLEPNILTTIEHLRHRGLRLAVVSNCFAEDITAWPQCALASLFDCTVFSCEVGLAKPDPAIYLEATRRLGVDVSDTWFIGDGQDEELSGATQAGLRAFRALWFLKRWPHYREAPSSAADLSNIAEILTLVEHSHEPVDGASTPAARQ